MTSTAFDVLWADIQTCLETEKHAVTQDIRNYPQPIAGCDAQIPALWERRDALIRDINRLAELRTDRSADGLAHFLACCYSLSAEDKQKFIEQFRAIAAPQSQSAAE